jgi:hypothetical protein
MDINLIFKVVYIGQGALKRSAASFGCRKACPGVKGSGTNAHRKVPRSNCWPGKIIGQIVSEEPFKPCRLVYAISIISYIKEDLK